MLRRAVRRYETFLRIDADQEAWVRLRARAAYAFGWAFLATQVLNAFGIAWTEGGLVYEHAVGAAAATLVFVGVHALRWWKNFFWYAVGVLVLSIGAPAATALYDHTGVNSALIPFLVMAPMINGFIAGPRMAVATGAAGMAMLAILFHCSVAHVAESPFPVSHAIQRGLQAGYALVLVTILSGFFSRNTLSAFAMLEENVRRARAAEAAKANFLAAMSHELRTPLNGVLGLTDAVRRTPLDAEQSRLMGTIETSGRALLKILNDILDLSKIDAAKLDIAATPFDPGALVRETVDMWRECASEKRLELRADISPRTPPVLIGDDLRIRQIISNFVSNALKFTDAGFVEISADALPAGCGQVVLRISVRDTGRGVPADAQARVFEAFEQVEAGAARRHDGTGLGLAICRRLASLMGGEVSLKSAAGEGATFTLRVPLPVGAERAEPPRPALPRRAAAGAPLAGVRVLLVEDNAVNRMVAASYLDSLGAAHEIAEDGVQCLARIETADYNVVLMDKHMPRMDGVAAAAAIRARSGPVASIPIVACTADAMAGEREALLAAGFDSFVSKPLSERALAEAILGALEAARGRNIKPAARAAG